MKAKNVKRTLCMLLALCMVAGILPAYVSAASEGDGEKKVEIAFVIDATGSMDDEIAAVKNNVAEFAKYLEGKGVTLRMSVVEYSDYGDTVVYTPNHSPWHTTVAQLKETLAGITTKGGDEVLIDALGYLTNTTVEQEKVMHWSSDAYKFAFVLTDEGYSSANDHGIENMDQMISQLNARGISVSVITLPSLQSTYKDLVEKTGGAFSDIGSSDYLTSLKALADNALSLTVKPESVEVTVKAVKKGGSFDNESDKLTVEGATVSVFIGDDVRYYTTDENGVAAIPLTGLTEDQINGATVSAHKAWSIPVEKEIGTLWNVRYDLQSLIKNSSGVPERFIYELHSEGIDDNGNWYGEPLSNMVRGMPCELVIDEPRMLINITCFYYEGDGIKALPGGSESYFDAVKIGLSNISQNLAQATDGHLMINKVLIGKTDNLTDFYVDSAFDSLPVLTAANMSDVRIMGDPITISESLITIGEKDTFYYEPIKITQNAHTGGFYVNSGEYWDSAKGEFESRHAYMAFKNLPYDMYTKIKKMYEFPRVSLSAYMNYGTSTNDAFKIASEKWGKVAAHEFGHYILGIYDDYLSAIVDKDGNFVEWGAKYTDEAGNEQTAPKRANNKNNYGLMDNRLLDGSTDIEISSSRDYTGNYSNRAVNTMQSFEQKAPAEGVFAQFLTTGRMDYWERSYNVVAGIDVFPSPIFTPEYQANYTISMADRLATYPYAALSDDDYIEFTGFDNSDIIPLNPLSLRDSSWASLSTSTNSKVLSVDTSGCIYQPDSGRFYGYFIPTKPTSLTLVESDEPIQNGENFSVNASMTINSSNDATIQGEMYSVASLHSTIDYTTISWFKYDGTEWTVLPTDLSNEENMNIGARCDYAGEGTYVLMAKAASEDALQTVTDLSYATSSNQDGVVSLTFNDPNADTAYYNIYYSTKQITSTDDDNVLMNKCYAGQPSYSIDFGGRNVTGYVAVVAIGADGARSPMSKVLKVDTGEADRDGDGIPDWYCDKYLLWPASGETKDIAASDDDGDGLTNLEEYQQGSDPKDRNDPGQAENIAVQSVTQNRSQLSIAVRGSTTVYATITPDDASNQNVVWYIDDETIATITQDGLKCTVRGVSAGTTNLTVVTNDGGYTDSAIVTVSEGSTSSTSPGGGSSGGGSTGGISSDGGSTGGSGSSGTSKIFTDVSPSAWYYDAVCYAAEHGLMTGYGDGHFGPDDLLNRAQIAKVFYNLSGVSDWPIYSSDYDRFVDVDSSAWFFEAVIYAADQHLLAGYGNKRFGPNDDITREQLATILYRASNESPGNGTLQGFSDLNALSDWAREGMTWAVERGIITGKGGGILDPKGNATRAEVAAMLMRYLENT